MFRVCALVGVLTCAAGELKCPPPGFDSIATFDLEAFVATRWYVQQQMEGGLEPNDLFQCQYAEYTLTEKPNFWGFEIAAHDHIDMLDGTNKDLHPCAKIVDASRGKLEVGECWLPVAAAGPYWVYVYNETAGYAAVGGGAPKHEFEGGCRTGTGKIGGGLWIFTREQQRDEGKVQQVRSMLKSQGFDLDALLDVDQRGCPTEEGPFPHHPRPDWEARASYARWLVHESDYATVVTHHNSKDIFTNIISVSDGMGFTDGNATGVVYTLLPSLDATYQDLLHDGRVSVHFAEKALPADACPGLVDEGSCGRLTVNGILSPVPEDQRDLATEYLVERDPPMKLWMITHSFVPFWIAPENISSIIWIDSDGVAAEIPVNDYFQASSRKSATPSLMSAAARPARGYNPRPHFWQGPDLARWLVHESDFAGIGVHHADGDLVGSSVSIADGNGYDDSDGVILMYLPKGGMLYHELLQDPRASLTFSEMAIANGTAPGCKGATAESPPCVRLTIRGLLTPVPESRQQQALEFLFNRHPAMRHWSDDSSEYVPFWMAPEDIDEFFLIPFYGGAVHFTSETWLQARWYRGGPQPAPSPTPAPTPAVVKLECKVCGHIYDADTDGGGLAFEDLPADWICPVCGARKSAYHPITFSSAAVQV